MGDIVLRSKRGKIQPAPAVHTDSAQQPEHAIRFVFPMRPEPGKAGCKLCIGG